MLLFLGEPGVKMFSLIIKLILKIKGIQIGKNFRIEGIPKIIGNVSNISFGNNVTIMDNVELKVRDVGKIEILDNVKIDHGVRIISANDAVVKINSYSKIMFNSIINAGEDIIIGNKTAISAFCIINSSMHLNLKNKNFIDQGYSNEPISIGDDVQIGTHSYVLPGVTINKGALISTHSVVQEDIPEYTIVAGIPARAVGIRK
jgi:acetyltransferase-like isoleucine patch superfamily enzyme